MPTLRPLNRQQIWGDLLLGCALASVGLLTVWLLQTTVWYPSWSTSYYLVVIFGATAVALRRISPSWGAILCFICYPLLQRAGLLTLFQALPIALATYWLVKRSALPHLVTYLASTLATIALCLTGAAVPGPLVDWWTTSELNYLWPGSTGSLVWTVDLSDLTQALALVTFAAVLGRYQARLGSAQQELQEQNLELRRLQSIEAERAVTAERNRISRDLHDVVAHHVTAIVVRAQATLHIDREDPTATREALAWIVTEAKSSLAAMRAMVSELRKDRVDADELLTELRTISQRLGSGMCQISLQAPPKLPTVSPNVHDALLRIAQEAVTNIALHSACRTANIRVGTSATALELEITDPGPKVAPENDDRTGNGLRHMAERATAVGGRLNAGPVGQGWRVFAQFPLQPGTIGS